MTDIDRLHKSIDNWNLTFSSRQSGKTTILIHQLAGEVQVGDCNTIFLFVPFLKSINFLRPMIYDVFREQNINIEKSSLFEILCYYENGPIKKIVFMINNVDRNRLMGYKDYVKYELDY